MFKKRKNVQFKSKIILVLIVIIASFLAAFVGQLVINNITNQPSLSRDGSFIIRQSQDRINKLQKAVDGIYKSEMRAIIRVFDDSAQAVSVANGVVLTNDGWAVVVASTNLEPSLWSFVRLESGEFASISQFIQDPNSSLVYLRLEADSLSPVTLGAAITDQPLESYILANFDHEIKETKFINRSLKKDLYLSSDQYNRTATLSSGELGDALYNEKSEMVGLIVGENEKGHALALDSTILRSGLEEILRNDEIKRASLGVHFVDLSNQVVSERFTLGGITGALISNQVGATNQVILPTQSPAAIAGVRLGDIIISVNGDVIDSHNTLSDYILRLDPADNIKLGLLRNGQPVSVDVILD